MLLFLGFSLNNFADNGICTAVVSRICCVRNQSPAMGFSVAFFVFLVIFHKQEEKEVKRKNLFALGVVLTSMMLGIVGCGGGNSETVTEEENVIVEESVESSEVESESEAEAESTVEVVDVVIKEDGKNVVEEQVEVSDYLSEHGIAITPCGKITMPMAYYNSDDVHDKEVVTSIEVVPSEEEGYTDTIFRAEIDVATSGKDYLSTYCIYDRYTGVDLTFTSPDVSFVNESGTHKEVCIVEVDGKQYDCSFTFSSDKSNSDIWIVTLTLHHPSDYDGAVFQMGGLTASRKAFGDSLDDSIQLKLADYPELLEDQYFFTATNN